MERDGNTEVGGGECYRLVEFLECDFHGITLRATGWFKVSDAVHFKAFGRGLPQDLQSRFGIFGPDVKFDASHQVGPEPVHTHDVLIRQEALDTC
jgi:hypothetical protein